jgi:hypothetical protein
MSKIIYEPHPVSIERKAELRAQGFIILDAIFKPVDVEEPTLNDGDKQMSKADLQAALDAKGIAYKPANSKADLQALLDSAE